MSERRWFDWRGWRRDAGRGGCGSVVGPSAGSATVAAEPGERLPGQLAAGEEPTQGPAVSATSLARRLRKLEAQRKPAELPVRYVWWDAGEPEPVAQPGERLIICSWDDHPEPRNAGPEPVSSGAWPGPAAAPRPP